LQEIIDCTFLFLHFRDQEFHGLGYLGVNLMEELCCQNLVDGLDFVFEIDDGG